MKKKIALTLTITILLSMAVSVYADDTILDSGSCGANLTYTIDNNGNLIIDGSGATDTYAVTGPLAPWHSHRDVIKTIQIGSKVTSIDAYAFSGLTSLETIFWNATDCEINEGLYEGHIFAFNVEADGLSVIFGVGVEKIPSELFACCTKLKNVTISNTVTEIGFGAFSSCVGLTNITIPASVATIGNSAFKGCTNLTNITIPNSVTNMGVFVFEDCSNLTHVTLGNGLTNIKDKTFKSCQSLKSVIFSANVDSIGYMAFYNCDNLTDLYYKGTKSEWKGISIDSHNNPLTNATRHYIAHTRTTISEDGKTFSVNPINIETGANVILALYDNGKFVEAQTATYEGDEITFTTTKNYTNANVMVWDNFTTLNPTCEIEFVK